MADRPQHAPPTEERARDPRDAAAWLGLAGRELQAGRVEGALQVLTMALQAVERAQGPAAQVHAGLAAVLRRAGRPAEALEHYAAAARLEPGSAQAQLNLGAAQADLQRLGEAAQTLGEAVRLEPALAPAREALVAVLLRLERHGEAQAAATAAPQPTPALTRMGAATLRGLGRLDEAGDALEAVLATDGDDLDSRYNLALVRKDQGRTTEAQALLDALVRDRPGHAAARLALCTVHLQPVYESEEALRAARRNYAAELEGLAAWVASDPAAFAPAVGTSQPFLLPYAGGNEVALQRRYGALIAAALQARYGPAPLAEPPGPGERLRVGVVSGFLRDHANWRIPVQGWVEGLDRARVLLIGYHTAVEDGATPAIAARFDRFHQGPASTAAWRGRIAADRPHVLIYAEVGMDPEAVRLAGQRLAPVQCNSWGHPTTSGLPTLDLMLSSADMEPPGAQDHYTERLVQLPGLSSVVRLPPVTAPADRRALGLQAPGPVYGCGQTLSKYLPRHDHLFAAIAAGAPGARFLFVAAPEGEAFTARFLQRLERAFAARGLQAREHCRMLPRMDAPAFRAAMGAVDVVLDCPGWSGCNTLLDALTAGLPVVGCEGASLRSRHGPAILRRAGLGECVAADLEGFVALAAALGRDPELRRRLAPPPRAELERRLNAGPSPAAALERVLREACTAQPR